MAPPGDASNRAASTLWVQQNAAGPGAGVSSWNGRSGIVVPAINDYNFTQIGPGLLGFNQMPTVADSQVYMNTGATVAGVTIPNCTGGQQSLLYTASSHTFSCNTVNPIVNSVFGRTGVVTSANGDYSFGQISGQTSFAQLPVAGINSVYGNISTPSALAMPACNNPNQALQWVPNGGFSCLVISGGGGGGGLPTINADSALGNPSGSATNLLTGMALPACTGSTSALQYSTGTHAFSCGTITATSPVTSVFGRTGAVVQVSGDYTFSQIGGTATLTQLPTATANSLLGGLTATAPSYLAVPSCSTANQALQWTSGTGFSCVTITAGTGTVTSFSSGNLAPLFTTAVTSPTVSPAQTFTLSAAAANTVFSNWTNSSVALPQFNTYPTCNGANQVLNYSPGTGLTCVTLPAPPANPLIASGTVALATAAIASGACATAVTGTATAGNAANILTTDIVTTSFNGDPTGVVGYQPLTTGMLTIIPYPTAGAANFKVCNITNASITPGAITLNWRVAR